MLTEQRFRTFFLLRPPFICPFSFILFHIHTLIPFKHRSFICFPKMCTNISVYLFSSPSLHMIKVFDHDKKQFTLLFTMNDTDKNLTKITKMLFKSLQGLLLSQLTYEIKIIVPNNRVCSPRHLPRSMITGQSNFIRLTLDFHTIILYTECPKILYPLVHGFISPNGNGLRN